jgi:hypothetical protein
MASVLALQGAYRGQVSIDGALVVAAAHLSMLPVLSDTSDCQCVVHLLLLLLPMLLLPMLNADNTSIAISICQEERLHSMPGQQNSWQRTA